MEFQLKQNAQKESNDNFMGYLKQFAERLRECEEKLNVSVEYNLVKIKLQDLDTLLNVIPQLKPKELPPKAPEIKSQRENSVNIHKRIEEQDSIHSYQTENKVVQTDESFSVHNQTLPFRTNQLSNMIFIKNSVMLYYENPVN